LKGSGLHLEASNANKIIRDNSKSIVNLLLIYFLKISFFIY